MRVPPLHALGTVAIFNVSMTATIELKDIATVFTPLSIDKLGRSAVPRLAGGVSAHGRLLSVLTHAWSLVKRFVAGSLPYCPGLRRTSMAILSKLSTVLIIPMLIGSG
eukprot:6491834-Amphidinium_carterae.6